MDENSSNTNSSECSQMGHPNKSECRSQMGHPDKSECLLLNLNNDCLLHIFEKLNWNDSINFAYCCQRLAFVSKLIFQKFTKFDWNFGRNILNNVEITPIEAKKIFSRPIFIGQYIVSLSITGSCTKELMMIMNNCTAVKSLKLKYCSIGCDLIKLIVDYNLEKLSFNNCYFDDEICWDRLVTLKWIEIVGTQLLPNLNEFLEKNVKLKSLILSGYFDLNRETLGKLKNLNTLSINLYNDLILDTVLEIDHLKKLEIYCSSCKNLNDFIKTLALRGNVEELTLENFRCDTGTFEIFAFTNFRCVTLINPELFELNDDVASITFQLSHAFSHIERFRLILRCLRINSTEIITLIEQLECMEELNLYECITNDTPNRIFMMNLLDLINTVLQNQNRRSPLRLVMPKKIMFTFGRFFDLKGYSINLDCLEIVKPQHYDVEYSNN